MRRKRSPRTPLQRAALILAAIGTLLLGYFLGNHYQQHQLQQHGAILQQQPPLLDTHSLPQALAERIEDPGSWVILIPGETDAACGELLNHYIEVYNRLAAWPTIQDSLHLALLSTSDTAPPGWDGIDWANTYRLDPQTRLQLTGKAGIAPIGTRWCLDVQATAAVAGPTGQVHALLPLDKPARMAESLRLLFETYSDDA